jgi:cyanobactin maturation PatA/PatG family protease
MGLNVGQVASREPATQSETSGPRQGYLTQAQWNRTYGRESSAVHVGSHRLRLVSFAPRQRARGVQQVSLNASSPPIPGLTALWELTQGDPRVTVAVLDGPVDTSHPCFAGASLQVLTLKGQAPVVCRSKSQGSCGHGTQIASLIFAQHGCGPVRGIAPRCRGLIVPIFRDNPLIAGGILPATQSDLARAIDLARDHGAHIINVSAGQLSGSGSADPHLTDAVRRCADSGVLIVSAAGNDGCDCLHVPAALPGVLVVGALDAAGSPAEYSNYGYLYRTQGLLAPGENLPVASNGGGFAIQSGTSYAAPLVSGLVALLVSLPHGTGGDGRRKLNAQGVRDLLLRSARPCRGEPINCRRFLAGTVDVERALALLRGGETLMTTPNSFDQTPHSGQRDRPQPGDAEPDTVDVPDAESDSATAAGEDPPTSPSARPVRGTSERYGAHSTTAAAPSRAVPRPSQVTPSGADCKCGGGGGESEGKCGCGCKGSEPERAQLIYALGTLSYDFGTQARFDGIAAEIGAEGIPGSVGPIPASIDTDALLKYLTRAPYAAESIIWTLNLEATPIYAIHPDGAYAAVAYERLRQFLSDQIDPKQRAERVAIPGFLPGGTQCLINGQKVPVVVPELRGMYNWTLRLLLERVLGKDPGEKAPKGERDEFQRKRAGITNFLNRVYYEIRNLGREPRDRALNFAATNAFFLGPIFGDAAAAGLQLDQIDVERSPICRLDADCWDVVLYFFNPSNVLGEARRAVRFTVDVSDVVPVLLGDPREWSVR